MMNGCFSNKLVVVNRYCTLQTRVYITLTYLQIDCFQVCCNFGIEDVMFYTMFIAEKAYLVNTKLSRRARLSLDPNFVLATKLP